MLCKSDIACPQSREPQKRFVLPSFLHSSSVLLHDCIPIFVHVTVLSVTVASPVANPAGCGLVLVVPAVVLSLRLFILHISAFNLYVPSIRFSVYEIIIYYGSSKNNPTVSNFRKADFPIFCKLIYCVISRSYIHHTRE